MKDVENRDSVVAVFDDRKYVFEFLALLFGIPWDATWVRGLHLMSKVLHEELCQEGSCKGVL